MRLGARIVLALLVTGVVAWLVSTTMSSSSLPESIDRPVHEESPDSEDVPSEIVESARPDVTPAPAESTEPARAAAPEEGPGSLTVWVVDGRRADLEGVSIRVEHLSWKAHEIPPDSLSVWTGETDNEGRFHLQGIPLGVMGVTAWRTSAEESAGVGSVLLTKERLKSELSVELSPAGSIEGVVRNADGAFVEGAQLYLYRGKHPAAVFNTSSSTALRATTQSDGRFRLQHIPLDQWEIVVRAPGYATLLTEPVETGTKDAEFGLGLGASVRGTVVDRRSQESVSGLVVALGSSIQRDRREARTDDMGGFEIEDVAEGEYRIFVRDEQRVAVEAEPFLVEGVAPVSGLRVVITDGGEVTGRVVDVDHDQGVSGIKVTAIPENLPDGVAREATTDSDGAYRVTGLVAGSYSLRRGTKDGYPHAQWSDRKSIDARLETEISEVNFTVKRGLSVRGRVVGPESNPMEGAQVFALTEDSMTWQTAMSKEDGSFVLYGFEPNTTISVQARRAGYAYAFEDQHSIGEETTEGLELQLETGASIEGTVVDSVGNPAVGVQLDVRRIPSQRMNQPSGLPTDDDGRFRIASLPAGTYEIRLTEAGQQSWGSEPVATITLEEGEVLEDVDLTLESVGQGTIFGRVTDQDGEPIPDTWLNAYSAGREGSFSVRTDEDGNFELQGLADDGKYSVNAHHNDYSTYQEAEVAVGTELQIELQLRGRIEGFVVRADNGEPVVDFEVGVQLGTHNQIRGWMRHSFRKFHDEEGRFTLSGVDLGTNTVFAKADGFATLMHPVSEVRSGETHGPITLRLDPGLTLEGVVLDPQRRPVSGAKIYEGEAPAFDRSEEVPRSDDSGRFVLRDVGSKTTKITATHAQFASASVRFDRANGTEFVELVLREGASIEGIVTLAGRPVPSASVSIFGSRASGRQSAMTDEAGRFELTGITPGSVAMHVSFTDQATGQGRQRNSTTVAPAGQATVVNFDFAVSTGSLEGRVLGADGSERRLLVVVTVGDESFHAQAESDGSFRFAGLPAGEGSLRVSGSGAQGWTNRSTAITISGTGPTHKDIELHSNGMIFGTIEGLFDEGSSSVLALRGEIEIPQLDMEVFVTVTSKVASQAQVEDGRYELKSMDAGTYTILAVSFEQEPTGPADLASARFVTHTVTLEQDQELEKNLTIPE